MYYEYENTQKKEKKGIIKIKKVDGDKAEIIQESLPQDFEGFTPSANNNNFRFRGDSMRSNNKFSFGTGFLDGMDDDMGNIDINMTKQNATNLLDYSEKVNINGYEGVFDSYNCICFFTFENIFYIRKKKINTNYYTAYQNIILDNFTSTK